MARPAEIATFVAAARALPRSDSWGLDTKDLGALIEITVSNGAGASVTFTVAAPAAENAIMSWMDEAITEALT